MQRFIITFLLGTFLLMDTDPTDAGEEQQNKPAGVKAPTLGGKQFWADELLFHQWRIQRSSLTGHYRLLDGKNFRWTWGTYETCRRRLEQIKAEQSLPPMKGPAVVVLHGLGRSRSSMEGLCSYLREKGDYTVLNVTYPTTQGEISTHAAGLAHILKNLEGIDQINFVAHSLGNLVIRHYLADQTDPQIGRRPDPRIARIVMLGPPNGGAKLARKLGRNKLFEWMAGKSGQQLARQWSELEKKLATPACQFGIIAGGRGRNPLLEGNDDLVVSVEETRLAGAHDFAVLPVFHTYMMDNEKVRQYTLRFLQEGHFISEEKRGPIAKQNDDTK